MKKLDITGEVCPITFIKVKLVLEDMDAGETLEVRLDDGIPARNVPKTLKADGHNVLSQTKESDGSVTLVVERGTQ